MTSATVAFDHLTAHRPSTRSARSRVSAASVARAVGVSAATVSYVLNNKPGVSAATRRRVIQVAGELGFGLPDDVRLARTRTHVIGLVFSSAANPYCPELSAGFAQAARRRGYEVFGSHTEDAAAALTRAVSALLDRNVDGIVIAVAGSDDAAVARQLAGARVPFVQVSRSFPLLDAPFVGINDRRAAVEIARHALKHKRSPLAVVIGPRTSSASAHRERGFVEAARAEGVPIPGAYRVSVPLTIEGGRAAAEYLAALPVPPAYVLCGSDILALGVMDHAITRGLRVPEDLAVSGFDGISIARTPMIDLTGVTQPRIRMANVAVDLLADAIEERAPRGPGAVCLPHAIRIGQTCGCHPTRS